MVNVTLTSLPDPLRDLALSYAPADRRAGLRALFALDAALGQVLRTTREPMIGQMRLAWWREALSALDTAPPPGEPALQALAAEVLPRGVTGRELSRLVDCWEHLLGETLDVFALQRHVAQRGGRLFGAAARVCNAPMNRNLDIVSRAWAFTDLANHLSDPVMRDKARAMAACRWQHGNFRWRWPRALRPLGAIALIADRRLKGDIRPSFVVRLLKFRLTGH